MNYIDKYIESQNEIFDDEVFQDDIDYLQKVLKEDGYNLSRKEIVFLYPIFSERTFYATWKEVLGYEVQPFEEWLDNF